MAFEPEVCEVPCLEDFFKCCSGKFHKFLCIAGLTERGVLKNSKKFK